MLLAATVKSSSTIPEGTVLQLDVDLASVSAAQRLDVNDLVDRYRVDSKTIRRWVRDNKVPFFRIGGKLLFHAADLDAIEEQTKIKARGEVPFAIKQRATEQPARNERMAA